MVSQRVSGVWKTEPYASFLGMPIVVLVIFQIMGLFYLHSLVVLSASIGVGTADFLLFRWILATFDRERMVTRLT